MSHGPAAIFVRFEVVGLHHWKGAPHHRGYLSATHRHRFGFEVRMQVEHDDRAVEFHDLIDEARMMVAAMMSPSHGFGGLSCEAIARRLAEALALRYDRPVTVSVDEDGECGALVREEPVGQ